MKKFVIKITSFFIVVIAVLIIGTKFLYSKIDNGDYYKIDSRVNNLVLGHSHTKYAFNDMIIKNTLNLSNQAEGSFYTYFKLKKVVENNKNIKRVFLSFTNNQIDISNDKTNIWSDKYMTNWFPKYGAYMNNEDLSVLYKNNLVGFLKVQLIASKKYVTFLVKKDKSIITDLSWGQFDCLKRNKIDSLLKVTQKLKKLKKINYSKVSLEYVRKMISLCKNHNVKIYFVRCPVHEKWGALGNEYFLKKKLRDQFYDVDFLDFKDFPIKNDEFEDFDHLNYKGSTKFSVFFNYLLENGLLKKKDKQSFINMEIKKYK